MQLNQNLLHHYFYPDIIYTTLCKMQQIYYIHNVVQMQLISYRIYTTSADCDT